MIVTRAIHAQAAPDRCAAGQHQQVSFSFYHAPKEAKTIGDEKQLSRTKIFTVRKD